MIFSALRIPRQRGVRVFDAARQRVESLTFDATLEDSVSGTTTVSAYPRQEGGVASEHAQPSQITRSMRVGVSATPLRGQPDELRLANVLASLDAIRRSGERYTLASVFGVWPSMVLTSMSSTRSSRDGMSMFVDLTWTQIEVVQAQTTEVPAEVLAAVVRPGARAPDRTQASTRESSAREKTIAAGLVDLITGE